jgi:hypothetical protein
MLHSAAGGAIHARLRLLLHLLLLRLHHAPRLHHAWLHAHALLHTHARHHHRRLRRLLLREVRRVARRRRRAVVCRHALGRAVAALRHSAAHGLSLHGHAVASAAHGAHGHRAAVLLLLLLRLLPAARARVGAALLAQAPDDACTSTRQRC